MTGSATASNSDDTQAELSVTRAKYEDSDARSGRWLNWVYEEVFRCRVIVGKNDVELESAPRAI